MWLVFIFVFMLGGLAGIWLTRWRDGVVQERNERALTALRQDGGPTVIRDLGNEWEEFTAEGGVKRGVIYEYPTGRQLEGAEWLRVEAVLREKTNSELTRKEWSAL